MFVRTLARDVIARNATPAGEPGAAAALSLVLLCGEVSPVAPRPARATFRCGRPRGRAGLGRPPACHSAPAAAGGARGTGPPRWALGGSGPCHAVGSELGNCCPSPAALLAGDGPPAMLTLLFLFAPRVIYPLSDSPSVKMSQSSPADEGTTFEHLWSTL